MVRRDPKAAEQPQDIPPYYIAVEPLYIGGSQFARAHSPGDRVPVDHVETYGWQDSVRLPDGYAAPDQPQSEPETSSGQATTSSDGKDA